MVGGYIQINAGILQGGLRRGGLTPACGFAHARIVEERYDIILGIAEASQKRLYCLVVYFNNTAETAQKRLYCLGVYFNNKERSYQ